MAQLMVKLRNEGLSVNALKDVVFGIRMVISSGYGDFGIASIVTFLLCRTNSPSSM